MAVAAENKTSFGPIVHTAAAPYFVALVFFCFWLSGADLSADLATLAIRAVRDQRRGSDRRRCGISLWSRRRRPARRTLVAVAIGAAACAVCGDRDIDRRVRHSVAACFRLCRRPHSNAAASRNHGPHPDLAVRAYPVDGFDAADSRCVSGTAIGECGPGGRGPLLRQHLRLSGRLLCGRLRAKCTSPACRTRSALPPRSISSSAARR
jgi:hypothetical protein